MSPDDDRHRRFLLGSLPNAEADELAARSLADGDELAAIEMAEAELIDAYLRGELDETERQQFSARLLGNARGRGRVAFARALLERTAALALDGLRGQLVSGAALVDRPTALDTFVPKSRSPMLSARGYGLSR
jgi:hypothetical protein